MRSLIICGVCVGLLAPFPLKAEVTEAPKTEAKTERRRPDKLTGGLLIGLISGLGFGVVDVALRGIAYRAIQPEAGSLGELAFVASPYVAFSVGSVVGGAYGVNRVGENLGHGSRLGYSLLGASLGGVTLGLGFGTAARVVADRRGTEEEPVDAFGQAAMGMMVGAAIGSGIGALFSYELFDPAWSNRSVALGFSPVLLPSGSGERVPGMMLSASF